MPVPPSRLHKSWFAYRELAWRFGQPQTVKAAMNHRGWVGGVVRPPLQPLTRASERRACRGPQFNSGHREAGRGNATRRPCLDARKE